MVLNLNDGKSISTRSLISILLIILLDSCTYTFYPEGLNYPVTGKLSMKYKLPDTVSETSGLETSGSNILTHNDSDGEPVVYSIDNAGTVIAALRLDSAKNMDWEDIASDDRYYYIADVGNNFGNRDTLRIFRFPSSAVEAGWSLVKPEVIEYSYDEETFLNASGWYSHDCEAMLAYNDSLYLFRKDWVNNETSIYALPAYPGYYILKRSANYKVKAQITGADILPEKKEIVLVGYRKFMPVLIRYSFNTSPAFIAKGGKARIYPLHFGTQVEGVCYDEEGRILVSSEKSLYKQAVYEVGEK